MRGGTDYFTFRWALKECKRAACERRGVRSLQLSPSSAALGLFKERIYIVYTVT